MACSSGCPTQDHSSYGECLRSKGARTSQQTGDYARGWAWEQSIKEYRHARSQGIQPKSTQLGAVREAVALSQKYDKPVEMV
jgi:hypothetical protein